MTFVYLAMSEDSGGVSIASSYDAEELVNEFRKDKERGYRLRRVVSIPFMYAVEVEEAFDNFAMRMITQDKLNKRIQEIRTYAKENPLRLRKRV